MPVRRQHARGAGLADRVEQRRPVRVIGEHEAAIERALTPDAPHPHQSGNERIGDRPEPPHPRRATCGERREDELARERRTARPFRQRAGGQHPHARMPVCRDHCGHHAVNEDRAVRVRRQLRQQPLRLAEGVAEHDGRQAMRAVVIPPREELVEDRTRRIPAIDRQSERALRDERVARYGLEGQARGVVRPLVVP
jgi:hypothetical protein